MAFLLTLDFTNCPPRWNEYLIRCNEMFEIEGIPVRVNENDRRNSDVCFCYMPKDGVNYYSISKSRMACDEVIEAHKRLWRLSHRFNKKSDVYHFVDIAIFVSEFVYFEIDMTIIFVKNELMISKPTPEKSPMSRPGLIFSEQQRSAIKEAYKEWSQKRITK